jgi:hypothetical protein
VSVRAALPSISAPLKVNLRPVGYSSVIIFARALPMPPTILIEETQSRASISRMSLEEEITKAVKADDACGDFAGVIVQRSIGQSSLEANWTIKGIKFGKAERDKTGQVVAAAVERMQRLYNLSDDHPRD